MRCHHGFTIGHAHTFFVVQDWNFIITWGGSREEMASESRVGYS